MSQINLKNAPHHLLLLQEYLAQRKLTAYLVGGVIRDLLQGRKVQDIDLAVEGDVFEVGRGIAQFFNGHLFPLDKERGIYRVVLPKKDFFFDLSQLKGDILSDLKGRDFTINAMAARLDPSISELEVIDPYGGEGDLKEGLVRVVTDGVFKDDPARLLRAIRICAELGFKLEKATERLILEQRKLILSVSGERIREELLKLLSVKGSYPYVLLMNKTGLIFEIFPELEKTCGVSQPPEHFGDVFSHSLETVKGVEFVLHQGDGWDREALLFVPWSEEIEKHFLCPMGGFPRHCFVKLSGLFHDIAKPQCRAYDSKGKLRFIGHAEKGAELASEILSRLRFSSKEILFVSTLIKNHLRPTQMSSGVELPTRRAVYRFFRDCGEAGVDVLFLSLADHLAARGPFLDLSAFKKHCRLVCFILEEHRRQQSETKPPKLIDGHEIMRYFHLSPGPLIGRLLEAVREAHMSGEIRTKEEALKLIERKLKEENPSDQPCQKG